MADGEVLMRKVGANMSQLVAGREPVVLVATGSFNPVHRQHIRMFYKAREYLASKTDYQVVGGLLSPARDSYVKSQLRRFPAQAVPAGHRLRMCEIAVETSSWLAVGRWEATRNRHLEYPSVLKHYQQLLDEVFPELPPRVMYLCGADHLVQVGPSTLNMFGCICVSRPGFTEQLRRIVGKKWRKLVHIVDDDEVMSPTLAAASSTKVRKRLLAKRDPSDLVGQAIAGYLARHAVGPKMRGEQPWTEEDRAPIHVVLARTESKRGRTNLPPLPSAAGLGGSFFAANGPPSPIESHA